MPSPLRFIRRLFAAGVIIALSGCASIAASDLAGSELVIRNVTVVSPEREVPLSNATVAVAGGVITMITTGPTVGSAATEIDGSGRFLTPGLIDSHVHLYHATGLRRRYSSDYDALYAAYMRQLPRSFLYYGYTTVVELNADVDANARFRDAPLHPDLVHCGQGLILHNGFMASEMEPGTVGSAYPNYLHDSYGAAALPEGAIGAEHTPEATVAAIARSGGACVKMYYEEAIWAGEEAPQYALPGVEIIRDVVDAAHSLNLPVILHATAPEGYRTGLAAGVDMFAHGLWDWPGVAFDAPDIPRDIHDIAEAVAEAGVGVQPTMRTLRNTASMFDPRSLENPALGHVLPARYLDYLRTDAQAQRATFLELFGSSLPSGASADDVAALQAAFNQRYERLIGDMDRMNARLLFGTDTAVGGFGWGNPPGLNGYWEMQGWVRGGVSLRSLFEAATLRNAEAFGLADELGSVEVGKRANLLLLDRNPLDEVGAYDSITQVILSGRPIERDALSAGRAP